LISGQILGQVIRGERAEAFGNGLLEFDSEQQLAIPKLLKDFADFIKEFPN
jgi:hypothetical protein